MLHTNKENNSFSCVLKTQGAQIYHRYIIQTCNVIRINPLNKAVIIVELWAKEIKKGHIADRKQRRAQEPLFDLPKIVYMWGRQLLLTKVRLIRTSLQLDSFRAALNQEVPHQLIVEVTCKVRKWGGNIINQMLPQ